MAGLRVCSHGGEETFKFSTDPQLVAKVRDVVGLYLAPAGQRDCAVVRREKSDAVLDRTQPGLPMKRGRCGTMHPRRQAE